MDLQLKNRLALVSGSTAGIGYAIAEALLREGARVIVNGRTQAAVDAAVAKLGIGAVGFAADLSTVAGADALALAHPDIDILVNNLGIFEPKAFEDIPDADWTRLFDVNVLSGVRLSRQVLPGMKRRNWGRILFISSESGVPQDGVLHEHACNTPSCASNSRAYTVCDGARKGDTIRATRIASLRRRGGRRDSLRS